MADPETTAATDDDDLDQDEMAAEWAAMAEGDGDKAAAAAADWDAAEGGEGEEGDGFGGQPTRVLNQDEIDSLLGFDDAPEDGDGKRGILSIINSTLVSYERLPMLEVVFDRVVRLLTTSLRNFTSDNVEVSLDGLSSVQIGKASCRERV